MSRRLNFLHLITGILDSPSLLRLINEAAAAAQMQVGMRKMMMQWAGA